MSGVPAALSGLPRESYHGISGDPNMARSFRYPACQAPSIASSKPSGGVDWNERQDRIAQVTRTPGTECALLLNTMHRRRSGMTVLDDVKPGAMIRGVVPGHSVRIVLVDWIGNQAINLVYREPDGGVSETTLYRDDENRLGIEARGRSWSFDGDGNLLRLVTEANRIALAHHFDPYLAIHTSLVDPLPHQISRRLWRDAGSSAAALPAGRRSGGGQDDHGRAADQGAACTGGPGALPGRRSGKPHRAMAGRAWREIRSGVRHPDAGHDRILALGQSLRRPRPVDRAARHARPQ